VSKKEFLMDVKELNMEELHVVQALLSRRQQAVEFMKAKQLEEGAPRPAMDVESSVQESDNG
jgi:hypothetical protein